MSLEPTATGTTPALVRLTRRADFLRAARARRKAMPGFVLQARERPTETYDTIPADVIRVGFTCSRKVGNAVVRNRAKRRLREIARAVLPTAGRRGWDYVLIGRAGATVERPFDELLAELSHALRRIHQVR